ncbi:arsenite methyltransferase [Parabacteroides sp. OttesenSCG-928-J18]|nr:arsenite methyltransferase [Parabacteroides sp. OttesenSCG-928-J18]
MDNTNDKLKEIVKQKYSDIALQGKETGCCCGNTQQKEVYNIMSDDYSTLEGYNEDADLGLGCGLPTQYAGIKKGDTVIDLGSGAGNDCFIAQAEVGNEGKIIGIDFSEPMIEKAKANAEKRGIQNVSFRQGDIEDMPVSAGRADVVISNCVLNLLPSKDRIFHEIYRVLKTGGHFCISDVVLNGDIPDKLKQAAEMYVGCVSGAIPKNKYLQKIKEAGFAEITICKEKPIVIPDEILERYLNKDEINAFKTINGNVIVSITVTGTKSSEGCSCGGCC